MQLFARKSGVRLGVDVFAIDLDLGIGDQFGSKERVESLSVRGLVDIVD